MSKGCAQNFKNLIYYWVIDSNHCWLSMSFSRFSNKEDMNELFEFLTQLDLLLSFELLTIALGIPARY